VENEGQEGGSYRGRGRRRGKLVGDNEGGEK